MRNLIVVCVGGFIIGTALGALLATAVMKSAYGSPADQQARYFDLVASIAIDKDSIGASEVVHERASEILETQITLVAPYYDNITQENLKSKILRIASNEAIKGGFKDGRAIRSANCIANYKTQNVSECLKGSLSANLSTR